MYTPEDEEELNMHEESCIRPEVTNAQYSSIDLSLDMEEIGVPYSRAKRWTIFTIVVWETMLFGGTIFGWAQIAYLLKLDGIYSHMCPSALDGTLNFTAKFSELGQPIEHDFRGCDDQDAMMSLALNLAIASYTVSSFTMGYSLHTFGLVVTRLCAIPLVVTGLVLIGFASHERPQLIHPGVILLSFGNGGVRACGLQFGDLFPERRSTALSVISGSQGVSAGIFLFAYLVTRVGITRSQSCWILACIASLSIPATCLMPFYNIRQYTKDALKLRTRPIKESVMTASTFLLYLWVLIVYLGMDTLSSFYNPWISAIAIDKKEAAIFSALFSSSMFLSPLMAFVPGSMIDYSKKRLLSRGLRENPSICGLPIAITTFVSTLKISCLFFGSSWAVYVCLLCVMYTRPTILSIYSTYIRIRYPQEHFDRLSGYGMGFTIVDPLIVVLIFRLSITHYFTSIGFIFSMQALAFSFPLYVLLAKYTNQ